MGVGLVYDVFLYRVPSQRSRYCPPSPIRQDKWTNRKERKSGLCKIKHDGARIMQQPFSYTLSGASWHRTVANPHDRLSCGFILPCDCAYGVAFSQPPTDRVALVVYEGMRSPHMFAGSLSPHDSCRL